MLSSYTLASRPFTQSRSKNSSVPWLLPLAASGGWLLEPLGRGWKRVGKTLEARLVFPKPSAQTVGPTPSLLAFLPEAAELCGPHDS